MSQEINAKVARLIENKDDCEIYKIAINKGKADGIKLNDKFIVYEIDDEEIKDPDTDEPLGYFEIIKGKGRVTQLYEKFSIVESIETMVVKSGETITEKPNLFGAAQILSIYQNTIKTKKVDPIIEKAPFVDIKRGDLAKLIN